MTINTTNQVLAVPRVYKGNVNTSLIKVGEFFKEAVRENCPALVTVWMQVPHYP